MDIADDAQLACSFCGATKDQVKYLIAPEGPADVYICDDCVLEAVELLFKEQKKP